MTKDDLCSLLEQTTRYTRSSALAAVHELVDSGDVWREGNVLSSLEPEPVAATHWSYGSGSVGCLYDSGPGFAATLEAAIEGALCLFSDLSEGELALARQALVMEGIWYFQCPADAGADYVEVCEQDGPMPEDCDV